MCHLCAGLCLEKLPSASSSISSHGPDRDQEIITCYEKSGDIALLYLQEMEKVADPRSSPHYMGFGGILPFILPSQADHSLPLTDHWPQYPQRH